MCKRDGCELDPAWQRGRYAGLCAGCAVPVIAAWRADRTARAIVDAVCEWRGCTRHATVRLFYGAPNVYSGKPCSGVNYCDRHADETRLLFHITGEAAPSLARRYDATDVCGAPTQAGGTCRRSRTPGEDTCPSHRAEAA